MESQRQTERRRHPRVRTKLEVELLTPGSQAPLRTTTTDVSTSGCYVEMLFTIPVGTNLRLALWFENFRVDCEAVVRTCDPMVGNGLEFLDLSPEMQQRLDVYLRSVPSATQTLFV